MSMTAFEAANGFGSGYEYTFANGKTEEVLQGKNTYLAVLFQTGEIASAFALVEKVANYFFHSPASWFISITANIAPIVWIPLGGILATIKEGSYTRLVEYFPNTLGRTLPKTVGKTTTQIVNFLFDHCNTFIRTTLVISLISLTYLGCHLFTGTFVGMWLFHEADLRGYLPRKISLFAQTYLPLIASGCLAIAASSLLLQAIGIISLASMVPHTNQFITHKMDALFRYFFPRSDPSLAEYESPLKECGDLSFSQIKEILNAKDTEYEVNPAHCTKFITEAYPKSYNFDRFRILFSQIKWNPHVVIKKLADDERFLDFLKQRFPGCDPEKQCNALQDNHKFFLEWMQTEYATLIDVLQGKVRPKGEQKDLAVAIENCAMILAYLENGSSSQVEKEDILLKLAVEGGYCARGIKRSSGEIVDETIVAAKLQSEEKDPQKLYARRLKKDLQLVRRGLIQFAYNELVKQLHIPKEISQDIHGFDLYRMYLSLGFYPIDTIEREQISIGEIFAWNLYHAARSELIQSYQLSLNSIISQKKMDFANYLRKDILSSTKLSDSEKNELIDTYTDIDVGPQEREKITHGFYRLILVKLGILRKITQ